MTPNIKRVVEALALSAPWALLSRFEELSHCIEASVCGVEVLAKHGIAAKIFPCSVLAAREADGGRGILLGFSREDRARIVFTDELHYMHGADPNRDAFHCAIEIIEERVILDLTLGQLCVGGIDVPPTFAFDLDHLAERTFRTPNGWSFFYEHGKYVPPELKQFEHCDHSGLREDFEDLVKLALKVGQDRFFEVLPTAVPPDVFAAVFKRILALRQSVGRAPSTPSAVKS
jgi:hypothetical protein